MHHSSQNRQRLAAFTKCPRKLSLKCKIGIPIVLVFLLVASAALSTHLPTANATAAEPNMGHFDGQKTFYHITNPMSYLRYKHYRSDAGEVSYCADFQLEGPVDGGTLWNTGADAVTGALDYYVRHGYPSTTTFASITYTPDEAETLTQLAIWLYRGSIHEDGSYQGHDGRWYNVKTLDGDPRDVTLFEAALRFYREGKDAGGLFPSTYCMFWTQPNPSTQNMLCAYSYVATGSIELFKNSAQPDLTQGNKNYSLENAEYGLYKDQACTQIVASLFTDSTGHAKLNDLAPGQYWLREITPPKGFKKDPQNINVAINGLQTSTYKLSDAPWLGKITVQKNDSWPSISEDNTCYSLAGAIFSVTTDGTSAKEVDRLTTDAAGTATSKELPLGTYHLVEQQPPTGYERTFGDFSATLTQADAEANVPYALNVPEHPQYDACQLDIQKLDAETSYPKPLGAASLAGAEFKISYYASLTDTTHLPENPTRSWTIKTDTQGKTSLQKAFLYPDVYFVAGDAFYLDENNAVIMPLGCVKVEETKAPEGYILPQDCAQTFTIAGTTTGERILHVLHDISAPQQVMRGDLAFIKAHGDSKERLAHIPFKLTSTTSGETHIITTDANGYYSSDIAHAKHTEKTNQNDDAYHDETIDASSLDEGAGTWFYGHRDPARSSEVRDSLGALPFDTYEIEELPCEANQGLQLVKVRATISKDQQLIQLGTIDDDPLDVQRISSFASTGNDRSKLIDTRNDVHIQDEVTYENLQVGATYRLNGVLIDSETGEELKDKNGAACYGETVFTPDLSRGEVLVDFTVNSEGWEGKKAVIFETLTNEQTQEVVSVHKDLHDANQTVSFREKEEKQASAALPKMGGIAASLAGVCGGASLLVAGLFAAHKSKRTRKNPMGKVW